MIERCRHCGSSGLRPWMRDGRNRDLVYHECDDFALPIASKVRALVRKPPSD